MKVAILLPAEAMLDFRLRHASPQSVLKWIGRLTDDVRKAPDAVDDRKTLEQICKREVKTFDERCASRESLWEADKIMSKVIRACTVLRNAPLLQQAVSGCAHRAPGAVIFEAVASSLHHLPFVDVEPW